MCVIGITTWCPCGHRVQHTKRCELACPLPESEVESDAESPGESRESQKSREPPRTPTATCPSTTTKFYTQRLTAERVPPLCPVGPDCLPADYWSCCKCQHLPNAGTKGGKGGHRQKKQKRLARFAPSCNSREAYALLQIGDVCKGHIDTPMHEPLAVIDEADEADEDDGLSETMDIDCDYEGGSCPMEGVVYEAEAEVATERETEPMDIDDGYDSAVDSDTTDTTDIPATDSIPRSTGCLHARCAKCLQWRRCPCGCNCRKVVPETHRRCQLCVYNKCRPHDPDMVILPRRTKKKSRASS